MMKHVALALGLSSACTSTTPPREDAATTQPEAPTPAPREPPAKHADAKPAPPAVVITNVLPGRFALSSAHGIGLDTDATIERRGDDGQWSAMPGLDLGAGFRLRDGCTREPDACVQLDPAKSLVPVPWSGMSCSSQCNQSCNKNVFVGPGEFRLTVRTCDGGAVASGPAFTLPAGHRDEAQLLRWGLADDVKSATIMRLDLDGPRKDVTKAGTPGALGGHPIRKGSEAPLDAEALDLLRALLRDEHGYDDRLARRCKHTLEVGIRMIRTPPTTGTPREQPVDLLLDFPCQRVFITVGGDDGTPVIVGGAIIDPSLEKWLELLRRGLPDDREIAKLKK
ncbi:MAG TPA: hypothetical protein VG755_15590 [Nannocystaceae bacterium]|nr:hypothetical protein [Nannocystaceae bacterium]